MPPKGKEGPGAGGGNTAVARAPAGMTLVPRRGDRANRAILRRVRRIVKKVEVLVNEDGALVYLVPSLLPIDEADVLFRRLHGCGLWERACDDFGPQQRLSTYWGDERCIFSYVGLVCQPHAWPAFVRGVRRRLNDTIASAHDTALTGCLANNYEAGDGEIVWHRDEVRAHGPAKLVVSLSTGGERPFLLRHSATGRELRVPLPVGSALVMAGDTQRLWEHALPLEPGAPHRISLTFRSIEAGFEEGQEPPHLL